MKRQLFKRVGKRAFTFLLLLSLIAQSIFHPIDVKADENIVLEINGYQINATLGAFRTVYSIQDTDNKAKEVGLVYGLADKAAESELFVGSNNSVVYSFAATNDGKDTIKHSQLEGAQSYVMTMMFVDSIEFYSDRIIVRPYAKLSDGTYVYGSVSTISVYDMADDLYQNSGMNSEEGHNYLYDVILSKVEPSYSKVEYVEKVQPTSTQQQTTLPDVTTIPQTTVPPTTGPDRPIEVFGEEVSSNASGMITVVWGNPGNGQTFNVYIDGNIAYDIAGAKLQNVSCASYTIPTTEGTHTIKITGMLNGFETAGVSVNVTVKDSATTNPTTQGDTSDVPAGYISAGANWTELNYWSVYFASGWGNDPIGSYKDGGSYNDFAVYVNKASGNEWGIQLKTQLLSVTQGNTYVCKVSATSNMATTSQIRFKDEGSQVEKTYTLVKGNNNFEIEFTAANTAQIFFDLGFVPAGMDFKITSFSLQPKQQETTLPPTTQPPTTQPPTTQPPTTQPETEEPTSEPPKNIELDYLYDGIDVASSSTTGTGNETSDKLFDNNTGTKMFSGNGMPIRIAWKMKQAVVIKRYTLTTANDTASYAYRNPRKWQLYGSNNATSWTQIDTVEDGGMAAENYRDYTYDTDVQESYQYYLIQFESNSGNYLGLQLSEISMFGDVARASSVRGEDLSQYFDGIDSANNQFSGYNSEVPANMFDDDTSTKMFSGESLPRTLAWKYNREVTIYKYSLTTANDNALFTGRIPKSWTLYGSGNGSNWEKIDRVIDSGMQNVNYTTYTYEVNKIGKYKYFKIEFTEGYGNAIQLSEIDLYGAVVSPSEYDILFTGDWNEIKVDDYVDELVKLFYNSYPRLYKRWGTGTEPKTITFRADKNYDGVAYCAGTTVVVSTTYANANPNDKGFFSHEITHSVQQYGGQLIYEDPGWWTENMANYGGFRYFHWSNPRYVQVYQANDTSLQDWGWQKYGNNKWFFAYMDAKYPTTKNADGSLKYGLIDSINKLIKNHTGSQLHDDPYDTSSPINQLVYQITGYNCMEALRLRFVQELQQGTWTFKGFGEYTDNWITEDIEGVPNPEYPMLGEKTHGNKTNAELSYDVTSGTNLVSGAKVYDTSGYVNANESASMLIDGNLGTKWCATTGSVSNPTYTLSGVKHWIMLDLGSEKTFNTYTMYNTRSKEGYGNATEWEILVSNDAKNWTSVDYQSYNNSAISSFNIGNQKARYVFIKVFTPDDGTGTLRLYEFQLYNQ